MATRTQYIELKKRIKRLAFENRKNRSLLKNAQRDGDWNKTYKYTCALWRSKREFRYLHIIASMLRGKTYEQIEPKVREENKISQTKMDELLAEYDVEKGIERPFRETSDVAEIICS